MADGNILEISAWVIPPIRYGDPGILTRVVNPITRIEMMRRRYFCIEYNGYFVGNHGTNTLVRDLYSSHSGLHAYLASWSGTPETKRRSQVIRRKPIIPIAEDGSDMRLIPSQNMLSQK
jgi:hypothetical protein